DDGLVMIADTRTNAGLDNISTYRKLHLFEIPGERALAICSAGNLSITQGTLSLLREGVRNPDTDVVETIETAPTMFRAAQLVGWAVRKIRGDVQASLEEAGIGSQANFLFG